MKKIIAILLLVIGSIGIGKDLDQYESKRVFDKIIEVALTGDYEKYKNDKEMTNALEELVKASEYLDVHRIFSDGNKYIVLDVEEQGNRSILTVKAVYKIYRDISEEKYRQIMEREVLELMKYDMEEIDEKTYKKNVYNIITDIAGNDFEIKEEVIKMNMIKKEKWDMEDNSDLIQRLYPAIFYMMESLNKRYFKTSEEGNI
ncbi:Uncharacterised protein [Sebaldella termitidis]|jgi:hypothetical protein|uniref:DUF4878 domain-containing protein n=1 Tax=Sebaldella termitidis (strain ATCC 33386 / NCTC 11300) TaxID=526218 RepID=D1ART7_SEBTE|nr:hypothetical protein [Sebaldella termitidis]ACZ10573.1 hypothetical protein Sterm_3739 [Sebaldella termitidis ATCC 33386]SUI25915.1 Uncharacterised protein [Sebaldella termitidis]